MEGLIPLVYKAIRRSRSRQQHTRSLPIQTPYFFVDEDDDHRQYTTSSSAVVHGSATQTNFLYITPPAVNNFPQNPTTDHRHHRRHKSVPVVGDRGYSFGLAEEGTKHDDHNNQLQMTEFDDHHQRAKQLVRFRSHRSSLFSCISGAA